MVVLVTMSELVSLAEAKAHLSEIISRVSRQHDRVTVTVQGKPAAVLLAPDDLASLEETIAVAGRPRGHEEAVGLRHRARSGTRRVRVCLGSGNATARQIGCVISEPPNRLLITPTVRHELAEHLPEAVVFAAPEFIVGVLLRNPYRVGRRLRPPLQDRYAGRRGTYRVIYRIDDELFLVTVVDAAHVATLSVTLACTGPGWSSGPGREPPWGHPR
jgi:mRNA interferase RelE/StbE